MYSFIFSLSLIIFFRFLLFRVLSRSLISLRWIPLSGEFVVSYPLVDSLGDEVYILFFNLLSGCH